MSGKRAPRERLKTSLPSFSDGYCWQAISMDGQRDGLASVIWPRFHRVLLILGIASHVRPKFLQICNRAHYICVKHLPVAGKQHCEKHMWQQYPLLTHLELRNRTPKWNIADLKSFRQGRCFQNAEELFANIVWIPDILGVSISLC